MNVNELLCKYQNTLKWLMQNKTQKYNDIVETVDRLDSASEIGQEMMVLAIHDTLIYYERQIFNMEKNANEQ